MLGKQGPSSVSWGDHLKTRKGFHNREPQALFVYCIVIMNVSKLGRDAHLSPVAFSAAMEIFGVITGTFTVIDTTIKSIRTIQKISNAQNEFDSLMEEIRRIRTAIQTLEFMLRIPPRSLDLPKFGEVKLAEQALETLKSIETALDDLLKKCSRRPTNSGIARVKNLKWLYKQNEAQGLVEKARYAKLEAREWLLIEIHLQEKLNHLREMSRDSLDEGTSRTGMVGTRARQFVAGRGSGMVGSQQNEPEHTGALSAKRRHTKIVEETTPYFVMTKRIDFASTKGQNSLCRCHPNSSRFQAPAWLGSWLLEYHPGNEKDKSSCTQATCHYKRQASLKMTFHLPPWLYDGALLMQAAYGSLGIAVGLRPIRQISLCDQIWPWLLRAPEADFDPWVQDWVYFPDDYTPYGSGFIEIAIGGGNTHALEYMLTKWMNILPHQMLAPRVAYVAHRHLEGISEKDDQYAMLLHKVLSLVEGTPDWGTTKVHEAARLGHGVAEAVSEEPWALNKLDCSGQYPIHICTVYGVTEALEELIQAGSNIDGLDYEGRTPVMSAAHHGHPRCVQLLIRHGCDVNLKDNKGRTALHHAAVSCHLEVAASLIATGATVSGRDRTGRGLLHYLALNDNAGADSIKRVLDLFLSTRKLDLDSLDRYGITPVGLASAVGDLAAFRCFIDAGASLQPNRQDAQQILPLIGKCAGLKTLQYVLALDPILFLGINAHEYKSFAVQAWAGYQSGFFWEEFHRVVPRIPTSAEKAVFIQLLIKVQDENLRYEKKLVEEALELVRGHRVDEAQASLGLVVDQRRKWKHDEKVNRYQGICRHIQARDFEEASISLEEDVDTLDSEIGTSPWETGNWSLLFSELGYVSNEEDCELGDEDYETAEEEL